MFHIVEITEKNFNTLSGFFETLSSLRPVKINEPNKILDILRSINEQDGHIFVAITDSNKIIGCATILIEHKFIHNGSYVGHIEDVATHHEYMGRGIGKSIINHAIEYGRKRGCYKIILDSSDESMGFYEKLGFKKNENHMRLDIN